MPLLINIDLVMTFQNIRSISKIISVRHFQINMYSKKIDKAFRFSHGIHHAQVLIRTLRTQRRGQHKNCSQLEEDQRFIQVSNMNDHVLGTQIYSYFLCFNILTVLFSFYNSKTENVRNRDTFQIY